MLGGSSHAGLMTDALAELTREAVTLGRSDIDGNSDKSVPEYCLEEKQ
jgi:hypothetical protein